MANIAASAPVEMHSNKFCIGDRKETKGHCKENGTRPLQRNIDIPIENVDQNATKRKKDDCED